MDFDIDVSGEDIFSKNYTICIANKDDIVKGFKFDTDLISVLRTRHGEGKYKYELSKNQKRLFKIRIYCIIIHYLFKSIRKLKEVRLNICKDFEGHANDINSNLRYLLEKILELKIASTNHEKLPKDSNAHKYAYLMRKDTKNKMKTYIKISLNDIEKFLKK